MSVTPDFIGQIYKDTATGNLWRANSLAAGDWTLELQDSGLSWEPTSISKINGLLDINAFTGTTLAGITKLTSSIVDLVGWIDIETSEADLAEIDFSSMETVDSGVLISFQDGLTTVNFSSLTAVTFDLKINNNILLTSINLSSLVSCLELRLSGNALPSISLPNYLPANGSDQLLQDNGMDAASVNAFLARCVANAGYVSGTVQVAGNTAPSGQGITDKNTLIARGVTVITD